MEEHRVIGLTGGIAAGKSSLAAHLAQRWGYHVVDADKLGHAAYAPGTQLNDAVAAAFPGVRGADGVIDRPALGKRVFGDAAAMKRLTDAVWPAIAALARAELAALRARGVTAIVLEAAVLVEAGWTHLVDEVWCVAVEPDVAVERLKVCKQREGVERAELYARHAEAQRT